MPASRLLLANVVICWRNCRGSISADNKYVLQKKPERACRALMKAADVESGGCKLKLLKHSGNLRGLIGPMEKKKKSCGAIWLQVCCPPAGAVLDV